MTTRRDFLQTGLAASAVLAGLGFGNVTRALAQQALTQDQLLQFDDFGNLTLIHITDCHAHLKPVWFREPDTNIGVGEAAGRVPHVVGEAFQKLFGIAPRSPEAYALTYPDFVDLAKTYGRMGGFDRVATVVKAIRAAQDVGGVAVATGAPAGLGGGDLRTLALDVRGRLGERPAVVLLASESGGKVALVAALNPAALEQGLSANDVLKAAAVPVAGRGGGKADVAQGGGTDAAGIPAALQAGVQAVAAATGR